MSTKLSLKEALEQPEARRVVRHASSGFLTSFALQAAGDVNRPVDLARLIVSLGHSLKRAHSALERIASGARVCLELQSADTLRTQRSFEALGVSATPIRRPAVTVSEVRQKLNLTQSEFALRFGFETETVRNWEQGRNNPDPAMQVFLAVIRQAPEIVDQVMSPEPALAAPGNKH